MPSKLPPGPRAPRVVQSFNWVFRPAAVMDAARARYGEVWTLRLVADNTFVLFSDPELVKDAFTADPTVLHAGEANEMIGTALLGKHSVILLDEADHMAQRKLLLPPFHGKRMDGYHELMTRICEEELAKWPLHEPVPLLPSMQTITRNMILSVIFGVTGGAAQEKVATRIRNLLAWGGNPLNMARIHIAHRRDSPFPKSFLRVRDPLDAAIFEEIERAKKDPRLEERDDVLAMLVQARREDGSPMTDREIRDQMVTLLIQGHHSTATALAWALERLLRHPDALERLRAEAQTGSDDYVDAVMKETLRLRPPLAMVLRLVKQPYQLGEYELEPGTVIGPSIYLLHRNEEIYPEPTRFRPERFLEQKAGTYTWTPFGGGDRHCIGRSFATAEIKAVLRTIALQTRLAPVNQADEGIRRRGMLLSPTDNARAVLNERVPASGPANVVA